MFLKYLKNKETIALCLLLWLYPWKQHNDLHNNIIIFLGALSFLAFVVQSIIVAGNNSGDASWLLSMGE